MLSGSYCPRNRIFNREGRKIDEEGEAESAMLEAVQWALNGSGHLHHDHKRVGAELHMVF